MKINQKIIKTKISDEDMITTTGTGSELEKCINLVNINKRSISDKNNSSNDLSKSSYSNNPKNKSDNNYSEQNDSDNKILIMIMI